VAQRSKALANIGRKHLSALGKRERGSVERQLVSGDKVHLCFVGSQKQAIVALDDRLLIVKSTRSTPVPYSDIVAVDVSTGIGRRAINVHTTRSGDADARARSNARIVGALPTHVISIPIAKTDVPRYQWDVHELTELIAKAWERADKAVAAAQKKHAQAAAQTAKEQIRLHVEARQAEVGAKNEQLAVDVRQLGELLSAGLSVGSYLPFHTLKEEPGIPPYEPGSLADEEPEPVLSLPEPGISRALDRLFNIQRDDPVAEARRLHEVALAEHAAREAARRRRLADYSRAYNDKIDAIRKKTEKESVQLAELRARFEARNADAVTEHFASVLRASRYPESFPRHVTLGYQSESNQLIVEYDLPEFQCIPEVAEYKYVKASDTIKPTQRPLTQRRVIYTDVVAQITLRTIHEIFDADPADCVETVVFNGYVNSIHPGTGQRQRPCLITLRVTKNTFASIDLSRVEPATCLRTLNAGVSRSPAELAPVRPVLDLSMVDPRFVEETDVLSDLDQRPNLMKLSPSEFESLITNLFEKMGLETRLTQPSRDGGVDCVAYDPRPIFGGKVVIQAKRYKNTVGVSAVRDLYGTLQNEGASKGILVTTSGYGQASFDFASGKPVELLDGANLLYLLSEHAGMEAKIEIPEDWTDPEPDSGD
jgi:restriction system protein